MAGQRLKWWMLIAACFALFMAILDNLVVNIALPTISRELNATTTQLQWIVSAYTLIFASLQITAGGLGDRLGRKRWFLFGLGLFTSASLLGALSQNITMLIAARAVQGLGAAFITIPGITKAVGKTTSAVWISSAIELEIVVMSGESSGYR